MAIRKYDTGIAGNTYIVTGKHFDRLLEINDGSRHVAAKMKELHGVEVSSATISESYYLSIKDQLDDRAADTAQAQPGGDCGGQGTGG